MCFADGEGGRGAPHVLANIPSVVAVVSLALCDRWTVIAKSQGHTTLVVYAVISLFCSFTFLIDRTVIL